MARKELFGSSSTTAQIRNLQQVLKQLPDHIQAKLVKRSVSKGLKVIGDSMRGQVPSQYKEIKRLIGERMASRMGQKHLTFGKVGAGVGRAAGVVEPGPSPRSGGVGIDANNIHWAIRGTAPRQKKSGASTGQMPPIVPDIVRTGFEMSKNEAMRVIIDDLHDGIDEYRRQAEASIRKAMG